MPSKRRTPFAVVWLVPLLLLAWSPPVHARVTRITIPQHDVARVLHRDAADLPLVRDGGTVRDARRARRRGARPGDPLNGIIQDIELGKDPDGKVAYTPPSSW